MGTTFGASSPFDGTNPGTDFQQAVDGLTAGQNTSTQAISSGANKPSDPFIPISKQSPGGNVHPYNSSHHRGQVILSKSPNIFTQNQGSKRQLNIAQTNLSASVDHGRIITESGVCDLDGGFNSRMTKNLNEQSEVDVKASVNDSV